MNDMSTAIRRKMLTLKDKFKERIEPRLAFQEFEIASTSDTSLCLAEGTTFHSSKLANTLKYCDEMVVFVCTIGEELEKEVGKLMKRNRFSLAYILDAIGSVAAESAVEKFCRIQSETYKKNGMLTTLRFSPGYCDWPIQEQKKIFSLLNSNRIDVTLLDSCLMRPRKSISGVFGAVPVEAAPARPYNPCKNCDRKKCDGRR